MSFLQLSLGADSPSQIAAALDLRGDAERLFRYYAKAERVPHAGILNTVEARLPGSRATFETGPFGSRLWAALTSDSVCELNNLIVGSDIGAAAWLSDDTPLMKAIEWMGQVDDAVGFPAAPSIADTEVLERMFFGSSVRDERFAERSKCGTFKRAAGLASEASTQYKLVAAWISLYRIARMRANRAGMKVTESRMLKRIELGLPCHVDPFGISQGLLELITLFEFDNSTRQKQEWIDADHPVAF